MAKLEQIKRSGTPTMRPLAGDQYSIYAKPNPSDPSLIAIFNFSLSFSHSLLYSGRSNFKTK